MNNKYKLEVGCFYERQKEVRANLPYWYVYGKSDGNQLLVIEFDYSRLSAKDFTWNRDWTMQGVYKICPLEKNDFPEWVIKKVKELSI